MDKAQQVNEAVHRNMQGLKNTWSKGKGHQDDSKVLKVQEW